MRYDKISVNLFLENRKKFCELLPKKSIAVFNSNDIMPTNADGVFPFIQNSDLFYLSGVDQEESILLIFPEAKDEKHREILFVKETNETIAIWEGEKLNKKATEEISGVKTVYWTSSFEAVFSALMVEAEKIFINQNEHLRAFRPDRLQTKDDRFLKDCMQHFPLHTYGRLAPIMTRLRPVKSKIEIDLIQQAVDITEKGFRKTLSFLKPNVFEYEIEAEIIQEFIRNKSRGFAYAPIIASGYSSCVLHYIDNNKICKAGDILLLDVGAEYANYASDMTRCLPVSGKFSARQKEVYSAVLRVLKAAQAMCKEGVLHKDYQLEVEKLVEQELCKLKVISMHDIKKQDANNPVLKKYFMHGVSHHMGIDVHDVDDRSIPFKEGMVLTVEPGIYLPKENLGIRLENDIVITKKEPINLMKNIPIEIEEIEQLMK